ncbi:NAD-dependent epimerase/dehydratase family protein [bacterium]|nr:NAD-dependent epimerase/dehydratase family protein [bacterium]
MLLKGKVLVTGGAGFIGREVVFNLIKRGYAVTVLDKAEKPSDFKLVKYIKGDIQNAAKCVMAAAGQDFVIHLAAKPRIPESFIDPDSYYDNNVTGTKNVLTAAAAVGVRKFIYASSSSIYGNNPAPHKPYHKPDPLNYYAMTKLFGEHLCKQYKNMFDLNYNVLRFFTVYGPEQPGCDDKGLMIAKFLRLAKEGQPLTVHGDGEYKRDYIHVSDIAEGIIASMESKVRNEVFNLGTGTNISVNSVVDLLRTVYPGLTVELCDKPKGYASETLADISKAKKLLGWEPKVNQISGITTYYEVNK